MEYVWLNILHDIADKLDVDFLVFSAAEERLWKLSWLIVTCHYPNQGYHDDYGQVNHIWDGENEICVGLVRKNYFANDAESE